jgi:ABC-type phosphate transport system substrate-binding protein
MVRALAAVLLLFMLSVPGGASAGPSGRTEDGGEPPRRRLVVIVNPHNPAEQIQLAELRRIFLRQITKWPDGTPITPYDQRSDVPARMEFSRRVFGKDPKGLNEYWLNLRLTRGLRPPTVCGSTALVLAYLDRVKGGIGYAYEDEINDSVKCMKVNDLD